MLADSNRDTAIVFRQTKPLDSHRMTRERLFRLNKATVAGQLCLRGEHHVSLHTRWNLSLDGDGSWCWTRKNFQAGQKSLGKEGIR